MERNTILVGDCVSQMKGIGGGKLDLIFADPPFNIGYKYDVYEDRKAHNDNLNWTAKWVRESYRLLRSVGSFWVAIGDEYAAEVLYHG